MKSFLALVVLLLYPAFCGGCSREREKGSQSDPTSSAFPKGAPEEPDTRKPPTPPSPTALISGPELLERVANSSAKGTLVNAWASWCGPCRREFPMLVALRDSLESEGLDVLFVSVDEPDTAGAAFDFASQRGLQAPILVARRPLGPFKKALNPNWPGMLPATFLFDENGKLRYFWGGPVYESELLPVVERFLRGETVDGESNFGLRPGKVFPGKP